MASDASSTRGSFCELQKYRIKNYDKLWYYFLFITCFSLLGRISSHLRTSIYIYIYKYIFCFVFSYFFCNCNCKRTQAYTWFCKNWSSNKMPLANMLRLFPVQKIPKLCKFNTSLISTSRKSRLLCKETLTAKIIWKWSLKAVGSL